MSTDDTTGTGYDPAEDPDSDPAMLNPREGAQAAGDAGADVDTDAEPANLNPRGDAVDGDADTP
ncbi:hypothetical protein [Cellulomonas sp. ES6]|uniref:hypothetical protein n=1 Tax=Cellulomonas sp. ES6 TaxID=3039384 RepID=UPI00198D3A83|nr:hypothetical protein [Cellulomonas sp. ES6]MBD3779943.1 hypothetical protein [Micrococcales bacterium]WHP17144.1 hypothetical protein P9841_16400 [Cellulomonas sp. ES6]